MSNKGKISKNKSKINNKITDSTNVDTENNIISKREGIHERENGMSQKSKDKIVNKYMSNKNKHRKEGPNIYYDDQFYTYEDDDQECNHDKKNESDNLQSQQLKQAEQIQKTGMLTSTNGNHMIHCLTIVGQVEGHYTLPSQTKTTKYEYVIPQLIAIEETPEIKGLIIILNTVGGDVEAGLAISELIAGMSKPTVSLVLGGGHSIGVPLAVSAKVSFIVPSATMTIHPVRMNGVVIGAQQSFSYFDKMQARIIDFICRNSKIKRGRFKQLLMNTGEMVNDIGTMLDGKMAVQEGIIDELGSLNHALKALYRLIDKN